MDITLGMVLGEIVTTARPLVSLDAVVGLISMSIFLSIVASLAVLNEMFPKRNKGQAQLFTVVTFGLLGVGFLSMAGLVTLSTVYRHWQPEFAFPVLLCGMGLACLAIGLVFFVWFAISAIRYDPQRLPASTEGSA